MLSVGVLGIGYNRVESPKLPEVDYLKMRFEGAELMPFTQDDYAREIRAGLKNIRNLCLTPEGSKGAQKLMYVAQRLRQLCAHGSCSLWGPGYEQVCDYNPWGNYPSTASDTAVVIDTPRDEQFMPNWGYTSRFTYSWVRLLVLHNKQTVGTHYPFLILKITEYDRYHDSPL